jgi:hypothetical protein
MNQVNPVDFSPLLRSLDNCIALLCVPRVFLARVVQGSLQLRL